MIIVNLFRHVCNHVHPKSMNVYDGQYDKRTLCGVDWKPVRTRSRNKSTNLLYNQQSEQSDDISG